jgi:transglutaminase-like putative cysteine protease
MRSHPAWLLGLFLLVGAARAAESPGQTIQDIWNAAYLEGSKAGYVHTTVRRVERHGQAFYQTLTTLNLTIKRNEATILLRMDTGSEETADGKVMAVSMRQYQGGQEQLVLKGTVHGGQLAVKVEGKAQQEKKIPWDDRVIGLYQQERLFQERKVHPGDTFSYVSYEPGINHVVTNRVTVKDFEEIEVRKVRQRLLRVETLPDKIVVPGASVQLPRLITWLDTNWQPVRSQFEIPQLGTLVLYRCSKDEATRPGKGDTLPDIAKGSLIPLNRAIEWPNETRAAVYRITVNEEESPATTFAADGRQECKNVQGQTFELHVYANPPPAGSSSPAKVSEEFLKSCYWINSEDARIQEYARQAVGKRTDPWEQAKAIERWVHAHMHVSYTEPFARASEVAKNLTGDCRQYGFLATAMCRAVGLPARTALGLCYAYDRNL